MAVIIDRTDRISMQAKQYRLGKALVGLATLLPYLLGWTAHKTVMVVWYLLAWLWAAVVVGWRSAQTNSRREL